MKHPFESLIEDSETEPTMLRRHRLLQQLRRLHTDAFNWALVCCEYDHALAEDVLQTVYLKVLEDKARYAGRSLLRTWLLAVVRNTAKERGST